MLPFKETFDSEAYTAPYGDNRRSNARGARVFGVVENTSDQIAERAGRQVFGTVLPRQRTHRRFVQADISWPDSSFGRQKPVTNDTRTYHK